MPGKKHLTRKEAKAQRAAGSSLLADAASLLSASTRSAGSGADANGGSDVSYFESLSANKQASLMVKMDRLVVSDETRPKKLREPIFAGPGHEQAQREAREMMISPERPEDRANFAVVQDALNVVIGLDALRKKQLPLQIQPDILETHKAAMDQVIEHYEILRERADDADVGLQLWATNDYIVELAQKAWDGCERWLKGGGEQEETGSKATQQPEATASESIKTPKSIVEPKGRYNVVVLGNGSRPSSSSSEDSASASSETTASAPNSYFRSYQQELEKGFQGAPPRDPKSADPETDERLNKIEASLRVFYQAQDAAKERKISFVEAAPSPRWLLGALLQTRMTIELLENQGDAKLTRYQRHVLELARRAEKEFEEVQRSEEERGGPEVWGPEVKHETPMPKQRGVPQWGRLRGAFQSSKKEEGSKAAGASAKPASSTSNKNSQKGQSNKDEFDSDSSAATDSSAEINRWAAEATRISLGGDTQAGMRRIVDIIFSGPGHEEEQRQARDTLFPSFGPPEDRVRFSQVQETINIIQSIPGVKEKKPNFKVTVPATVLEAHKASMERIIRYYLEMREQKAGMKSDGDIIGSQKIVLFHAERAWGVCSELLDRLRGQRAGAKTSTTSA